MDRARTPGHPRGRDLCPRRAGEPGALADKRASTGTRVRESDDTRRYRAGANRRIRPRINGCERLRIDSCARQPVVRPRTNIGAVGPVCGVAVRIERTVQSAPRRFPANRHGCAGICPPDALIEALVRAHTAALDSSRHLLRRRRRTERSWYRRQAVTDSPSRRG